MEQFPARLFFLLAGFAAVSSAGVNLVNTLYVEAGTENFTLPFPAKTTVEKSDTLMWKYNNKVVFRKPGPGSDGFTSNPSWDLVLPAAVLKVGGKEDLYSVEVHNNGGVEKLKMTTTLHLLEKVKTPTLSFNCTDKDNAVLTCFHNASQKDLVYEWTVKNKKSKSAATLKVHRKDFGKVTCSVSNKAVERRSNAVEAICEDTSASAVLKNIYHDYFWYIVGGGGGLVLLLFFITVLGCVRARSRRKHRMNTESELRLEWTKQTPRQDPPPTQRQKKKRKEGGPQSGGPQPHRCKTSRDAAAAGPLASKDHAAVSSANPPRPRAIPRLPQSEDGGAGVDHGPPLPKPRKKAGAKTPSRPRP